MALRFNPPPNWPAPPDGFVPPAGWQPDPAWGPAPEGWQLWVDDAAGEGASTSSAPQTSSASDPAWIPTQAVSTGASAAVADPTGAPVSAPSGDYASSQAGPGPAVSSGPMAMSAPSASPYAASMNYSQSPAPYQGGMGAPVGGPQQAPVGMPQQPGWQPIDINTPADPAAQYRLRCTSSGGSGPSPPCSWWHWWVRSSTPCRAVTATVIPGAAVRPPVRPRTPMRPRTQSRAAPLRRRPRLLRDRTAVWASPSTTRLIRRNR